MQNRLPNLRWSASATTARVRGMTAPTASPPDEDPRRRRRRGCSFVIVPMMALVASGCTATVTPPSNPSDQVQVFILSEAMHTGVVLPPDPGASGNPDEYVEFGFGDWGWWALTHDSWYNGFATVLWPSQGALGRRTFGAHSAAELRSRARWATLQPIMVNRQKASALRRRLQSQFDGARKHVVVRRDVGFKFVPVESYSLLNNCADLAGGWLEALDCQISWVPVRYDLRVSDNGKSP